MTKIFSFAAGRDHTAASHTIETISDAALDVISGGADDNDKSWRNDYHFCANGSAGGGRPGLYPLYIKCK